MCIRDRHNDMYTGSSAKRLWDNSLKIAVKGVTTRFIKYNVEYGFMTVLEVSSLISKITDRDRDLKELNDLQIQC